MKTIAITGASAGIGRAAAVRLARDGAAVAVCARRADRLEEAAAEIARAGGQPLTFPADVSRADQMEAFVRAAVERFGRLDVMICNAGFGVAGALDRISPAQMSALVETNYMGTFLAARAALPEFRRQGRGHLIVVSSIVGKRAVPYMGAYAATKFAQVGLAESLRAECVGTGIHVTVVYPVSTDTEFFEVMTRETGAPVQRRFGPNQSAEVVADAIARAIAHPRAEVYPYPASRALVWMNAIAPGLVDRFVKRFGREPR
jgi:short-subunit dehydrogenase